MLDSGRKLKFLIVKIGVLISNKTKNNWKLSKFLKILPSPLIPHLFTLMSSHSVAISPSQPRRALVDVCKFIFCFIRCRILPFSKFLINQILVANQTSQKIWAENRWSLAYVNMITIRTRAAMIWWEMVKIQRKSGKTRIFWILHSSQMDLQRRGQSGQGHSQGLGANKGRVYWRCYFNAVTCF